MRVEPVATGTAPGKVILLGEHAVVYGQPALAATLGTGLGAVAVHDPEGPLLEIPAWGQDGLKVRPDRRSPPFESLERGFQTALEQAGLDRPPLAITLEGELPPGVGLGSSAAFAVALLRLLGAYRGAPFDEASLIAAAAEVERVFHGTPSGLDHTVVAKGGCLRFCRAPDPVFERIVLPAPVPVVVAWAPREGVTRDVVDALRDRHLRQPALYDRLFGLIGEVVEAGTEALAAGDWAALGRLFDVNHGLLSACGVSRLANEQMVAIARGHGALGAKLTGAGWGGAVVAIAPEKDVKTRICAALIGAGFDCFATDVGAA